MTSNCTLACNINESEWLAGNYKGSCGCAVIVKNCVTKNPANATSRAIERGTLIQVWSNYIDVRFSVVIDKTGELDETCLVCSSNEIAIVPKSIWGALFPIEPSKRADIARNKCLLAHLERIDIGHVILLNNIKETPATIIWKSHVHDLPFGVYFGVIAKDDKKFNEVMSINSASPQESIVTLDKIFPTLHSKPGLLVEMEKNTPGMAKSLSQNTLRPISDGLAIRHTPRSLDSTTFHSMAGQENASLNSGILHQRGKGYPTSRSFDSSQSTCKKLARSRACTSLDSASNLSKGLEQNSEIGIGSLVEIILPDDKLYGVVQWIGHLPEFPEECWAGIETEEKMEKAMDPRGLFSCDPYKAYFVPLQYCRQDPRFLEFPRKRASQSITSFGQIDCPVVKGTIPPITEDLKNICGKNRGIQGHHNSCYLDSTLFAMFAFTSVFDSLLYRPKNKNDIPQYEEVQGVLRDEIVNPLRSNLYVRADRVMKLRTQLEQLSSVSGLTSEEKDPEEFLNSLLAQILRAEPFLQLSSGQDAFHYQLFVEKDERLNVPTVQQLFEQSFVSSDIKLKQLPPCLIVQMPRFGKSFKMYPCIIPPTELDVTDVIENSPRQCIVCGTLAEMECRECYLSGMEGWSFCRNCLVTVHKRGSHVPRPLLVPTEFSELQEHCAVPRLVMKLFAVVCIETSHYVAFLNTNQGWVFFDSMADRKGEQNGYNIPEIVPCPDVPYWLSNEGAEKLSKMQDERHLPDLAKRLLCDAYMCMYQSPDIMMYR